MLFRIIGSTKSRNSETGLELRSSHHAFDAAVLASDRFHGVHQPRQQTLSAALDKAQLAQLQVSAEGESERAHLQLLQ